MEDNSEDYEQPVCDEDQTNIAEIWCEECSKLLSNACDEIIHENVNNEGHTRASLDQDEDEEVSEVIEEEEYLEKIDSQRDPFEVCSSFFLASQESLKLL